MSSDEEIQESQIVKDKLPAGWRRQIKSMYEGIRRDLGSEAPSESKSRQNLRAKLFELEMMIYSKQVITYWNTKLPGVMQQIVELVKKETTLTQWWPIRLEDCIRDLRFYGTSLGNRPSPLN
jgi:hypothetical protein